MKNLWCLSTLTAAIMMSSCSNDLTESQASAGNGKAITFNTWANKQLRSVTTDATMTDFQLAAWIDGHTAEEGTEYALIPGLNVTGGNPTWTYSPTAYWPGTTKVNFYAYSPAAAVETAVDLSQATTTPTITYKLPGHSENGSGLDVVTQEDLLVANHQSEFATEGNGGVTLNFRHGLSRILVQARSESAQVFVVTGFKLKNIKSSGKLDLSSLPKDGGAFTYPTNNATVATPGYQTYWDTAEGTDGDLVADLGAGKEVAGGGALIDIIDDANALYVIPQENPASTLQNAVDITANEEYNLANFYIEITYYEKGDNSPDDDGVPATFAVPIPAIVGNAYASSIAFEMERQYTFQFELFGRQPISIAGVSVSAYNETVPAQDEPLRLSWAGSNIYWTGSTLTFDDSDVKTHEQYQGLYFKWGGLVGISPSGTFGTSTQYYSPNTSGVYSSSTGYSAFTSFKAMENSPSSFTENSHYLTEQTTALSDRLGDICKYLTLNGSAPAGKHWRMPTAAELATASEYTSWITSSNASTNTSGTAAFSSGVSRKDLNKPFFPASGRRDSNGSLGGGGSGVYMWTASPASSSEGWRLIATQNEGIMPLGTMDRNFAASIRCVVE